MMKKFFGLSVLVFVSSLFLISCGGGNNQGKSDSQSLSGSGATFPLPFYNVVFEQYSTKNGNMVAYGGIGSGGGIRNLKDMVVDFAGSDAFLTEKEMESMPDVIHIPTCMGAVVLAYNLKGVDKLNLTGDVIADIFAGQIKVWNDPRIVELNPEVTLPSSNIMPVFRSDGSGTTFVFTDYLAKVSSKWAETYGYGKSVNFPVGQAAKGNPGVAGIISNTENTIGYIGSEYAFAQKLKYAMIQNAAGEFVEPNTESISASASGNIPTDTRTSITNSSSLGSYPISTFTWLIIYKEQNYAKRSKEQALATLDLIKYILSNDAQSIAAEVHYAPLPEKAIELSLQNLKTVTFDGTPLLQ